MERGAAHVDRRVRIAKPNIEPISTIEEFVTRVSEDREAWGQSRDVWFRGEKEFPNGLLTNQLRPKLYWPKPDGTCHDENQLLQRFRQKAPTLAAGMEVPPRSGHTDQWLFLARHVGLPTRLLDWTEGALIALYFALQNSMPHHGRPVVWMLDPAKLNAFSVSPEDGNNEFPLTWFSQDAAAPSRKELVKLLLVIVDEGTRGKAAILRGLLKKMKPNIDNLNVRGAWEKGCVGTDLPVAVHPTDIHPRMAAQKKSLHRPR
jgi:hypothetical protein